MATETMPATSLYFLQQDAPSLMPLYSAHPEISIVFPSSPDYLKVHTEYNTALTTVPMAIILPADVAQLAAAVKHCASQRPPIPMTVRGGGHDAHGRHIMAGAAQLDLRLMKWTKISPPAADGTATVAVGPGTLGIEMQRALSAAGLAAPTGWVGSVGVTGWACGGGYGMEAGAWGLGVDNIVGAQVVTPGGAVVDTADDPELLWAVRGAGLGNFGVISELRLTARPDPRFLAGFMAFPLADAEAVLCGFQAMCDKGALPPNFSGELTVAPMPQGPAITFMFAWIAASDAELAAGWAFRDALRALGPTVWLDDVAQTSILRHRESMHGNPAFNPVGYTSMYALALARITPSVIAALKANPPPPGSTSAVLFHHAHGAAVRPHADAAWAHRAEHFIMTPVGFATPDATPSQQEEARRWAERLYTAARATGLGLEMGYWSLMRPEHCDAEAFFGRDAADRLRALKKKYNPLSVFPQASPVLV